MRTRFEFAFAPSYRLPALLFGIRPATAYAVLADDELRVRFGPWSMVTSLDNVVDCELSGDFRWVKTAGPPHLSFSDRGATFATNGDTGVCVRFTEPVPAIDPTRRLRHPGATLTLARPHLFREALLGAVGRTSRADGAVSPGSAESAESADKAGTTLDPSGSDRPGG